MGFQRGDHLDAMESCPAMGALRQHVFVVAGGDGHDNTDALRANDGAPAWLQTHLWFSFHAANATGCCLIDGDRDRMMGGRDRRMGDKERNKRRQACDGLCRF